VVLDHPDFRAAKVSTRWLEEQVDLSALEGDLTPVGTAHGVDVASEGDRGGEGTLQGGPGAERDEVWVAGRPHVVRRPLILTSVAPEGSGSRLSAGRRTRGGPPAGSRREVRRRLGSGTVTSPMQGTLVTVAVTEGQSVIEGEVVAVMEAMKMENAIRAAVAGTVASVVVKPGDVVSAGAVLVEITPVYRPAGPAPEG
jgi:acetyl-CoA/propionyl-CoA carboxylase biotin carboxyl carrier protein